jgi:hypothetical protein
MVDSLLRKNLNQDLYPSSLTPELPELPAIMLTLEHNVTGWA